MHRATYSAVGALRAVRIMHAVYVMRKPRVSFRVGRRGEGAAESYKTN